MDGPRLDALTRSLIGLTAHASRRAGLRLLVAGALPSTLNWMPILDAGAKKNKKKKSKKQAAFCLDGQTLTIAQSKKKVRQLRQRGATPGACQGSPPPPPPTSPPPVCTPTCPSTICGGDDGCGGACGCAAGSVCYGGICQACTIACPTDNHVCDGTALKTTLAAATGGTIFVCPGRYIGNFEPGSVTIIGAGDGDDPSTSTILDANGSGRVLLIASGKAVTLQGIRMQGGAAAGTGGGVRNEGSLSLAACTVTGNEATSGAGGIFSVGALTLTRCRVTSNKSTKYGGGIGVYGGTTTLARSVVSQNEARNAGGGIDAAAGTVRVTDSSQITRNSAGKGAGIYAGGAVELDASSSVTDNTATSTPSGIVQYLDGFVTLNGATVSGNTPLPQCSDGIGCP